MAEGPEAHRPPRRPTRAAATRGGSRAYVPALVLALASLAVGAAGCESCGSRPGAQPDAGAPDAGDAGVVNATVLPTASVEAMVNPDKLPAYKGATGSIEGTIYVTGDPPLPEPEMDYKRCPDAEPFYGKIFREGPADAAGKRPLGDAIVVITGYAGFYVPEKEEAKTVEIKGCTYETRTVTMTFGQRLEVKNLSGDFWTPVLEPGPKNRLIMATPKGDPARLYPKQPGRYLLLDFDRKYANADIYVFLHPLHAASNGAGAYRIDGVPVGKVKVNTTHPRFAGEATKEIDVTPGLVQRVDLVLEHRKKDAGPPREDDAGPHPRLR